MSYHFELYLKSDIYIYTYYAIYNSVNHFHTFGVFPKMFVNFLNAHTHTQRQANHTTTRQCFLQCVEKPASRQMTSCFGKLFGQQQAGVRTCCIIRVPVPSHSIIKDTKWHRHHLLYLQDSRQQKRTPATRHPQRKLHPPATQQNANHFFPLIIYTKNNFIQKFSNICPCQK